MFCAKNFPEWFKKKILGKLVFLFEKWHKISKQHAENIIMPNFHVVDSSYPHIIQDIPPITSDSLSIFFTKNTAPYKYVIL